MNRPKRDHHPSIRLTREEIEEYIMMPPDASDDESADDSDADPDYDPDLAHTSRLERLIQSKYNHGKHNTCYNLILLVVLIMVCTKM